MPEHRLDKIIRESGRASKREVREFIKLGLITVNGRRAESAAALCGDGDVISVEGEILERKKPVYIIMNKPGG